MPIQVIDAPNGVAAVERVSGALPGGADVLDGEVDRIVALYRSVGRALRANDPANWAAGLTMPQLRVLFYVGRYGPVSVGQVAAGVGISQPSATETLEKLVRHELVERTADPADRRIVRNALTEKGREMIDRPWETRRALLASVLHAASPAERATMEKGLALLSEALERAEEGEGRA
ncbi:MAG: hypothetical protein AVDCRST_MAG77-1262 [uncultured Chloroflexi bacterium]|uniref:HTH marR-type domain-containing protein n=1 Tax=uncultured Chloroflexota bacterium TaxID=166587 RepID=A0A6J4HXQ5_9CHLR|nr:MAG: hypothetical protein AVDCRST_MAG77-1262 [uncultured Chloroflexota bacterium]